MARSARIRTRVLMLSAVAAFFAPLAAAADEMTLPVPNVVIYPGDIVRDYMIADEPYSQVQGAIGQLVESREQVIGRIAKRTLLPGKAILWIAVGNPRAVSNGSQVKLFFDADGLDITTQATALQDGAVGDMIRVRNTESGLMISGTVQADGSVRVGG